MRYNELRLVQLEDGNNIVLNKNGSVSILGDDGRELEAHNLVIGSVISVQNGGKVKKGEAFVQWDPYNVPILSEKAGRVKFSDIIEGVTMKQEVDETTAQEAMVIIEHKEDLHPQIVITDEKGEALANYPIPSGAHIVVNAGDKIVAGTLMAKTPRKTSKTKDITGGLPRVAELFESAPSEGRGGDFQDRRGRGLRPDVRGKRCILIKNQQTNLEEEHLIPIGKHVIVFKGDYVKKGQQLTEGPVDPHEFWTSAARRNCRNIWSRSAGGLPPARRDDQRQAHRDHRAADAAQGAHHRTVRHDVPVGRTDRQDHL